MSVEPQNIELANFEGEDPLSFAVRCLAFEIQPFSLWGWQPLNDWPQNIEQGEFRRMCRGIRSQMLSWRLQIGLAILLFNAAYLYSDDSPSLFYVINILLHLALGLLVWVGLLRIAKQQFRTVSRMGQLALLALALSGASGVALARAGRCSQLSLYSSFSSR